MALDLFKRVETRKGLFAVEKITLTGFKYPLDHATLHSDDSLGVSNEITEDTAVIEFEEGIAILIESRD